MTRKRFKKLLMSKGYSRDEANDMAFRCRYIFNSYKEAWDSPINSFPYRPFFKSGTSYENFLNGINEVLSIIATDADYLSEFLRKLPLPSEMKYGV